MPTITLQPRGPAGFEGYSVLSANPPRDPVRGDGKNGDFWVNQRSGAFFQRSNNAWRLLFSLLGKKGDKGDTGPAGKQVLYGPSPPAPLAGADGDFYIQTAGADDAPLLYGPKAGGSWPSAVSLVGPQPFSTPIAWSGPGLVLTATAPASSVTYLGETYVCTTSHTTAASFDPSKFVLIAAKGADGLGTGSVNPIGTPVTPGHAAVFASSDGTQIASTGAPPLTRARATALIIALG